MTLKDGEKLKRLHKTFELNFKITRLYAAYLENCPELITRVLVEELSGDTGISKTDALGALVCEILGIDEEMGADARRLSRDYVRASVRLLDAEKYRENKYYKNIKIDNVKDGRWELRKEYYAPYRAVICHDMMMLDDYREVPPLGFFEERFDFPAVLEDGNEWMTLTPVDLDTCDKAIEDAHGKVVTFGLGLGYYAYMVSEKENVSSVTVVEKSEDVIRLFRKHIFPQIENKDKIRIVCADAFEYAENSMPEEHFDYAFVDTWRDASDGAPMYRKMKKLEHLSPSTEFSYWIENFLISRIRAMNFVKLSEMIESENENAPKSYEEFIERLEEIN